MSYFNERYLREKINEIRLIFSDRHIERFNENELKWIKSINEVVSSKTYMSSNVGDLLWFWNNGLNSCKSIMDFGCGSGYLTHILSLMGKNVVGYEYGGIDVGGQFIENDSRIVFVSDRLGNPNIFAQGINSTSVERLVYHSNNNSSATAFGNNIVYSSKDSSNELGDKSFNLYLISTKTDSLKRLTTSGVNQFPKFSTDGQTLLFIKTFGGTSSIGIIRLDYSKSFLFPLQGKRIQSIDW
jgi:SAM-dependent methyltransferase